MLCGKCGPVNKEAAPRAPPPAPKHNSGQSGRRDIHLPISRSQTVPLVGSPPGSPQRPRENLTYKETGPGSQTKYSRTEVAVRNPSKTSTMTEQRYKMLGNTYEW